MTDRKKPTLADLIARTPAAQPIQKALASIKARRDKLLAPPDAQDNFDFGAPEPMPVVEDPDQYAKGFFARLMQRDAPPRGVKPRLVVDNTPGNDDDPEPPKAA